MLATTEDWEKGKIFIRSHVPPEKGKNDEWSKNSGEKCEGKIWVLRQGERELWQLGTEDRESEGRWRRRGRRYKINLMISSDWRAKGRHWREICVYTRELGCEHRQTLFTWRVLQFSFLFFCIRLMMKFKQGSFGLLSDSSSIQHEADKL